MGRGSLNLKPISNPKSRRATFLKRKKNLIKKAYELSTLCDVRTSVFVASSSLSGSTNDAAELETWPPNRHEIEAMIRDYKTNSNPNKTKRFDLNHFFSDRKAKLETEISKFHETNNQPKWDHGLNYLSENQLKEVVAFLDSKIGAVDDMIESTPEPADAQSCIVHCTPFETHHQSVAVHSIPTPTLEEFDVSGFWEEDFQLRLDDPDPDLQFLLDNIDFNV